MLRFDRRYDVTFFYTGNLLPVWKERERLRCRKEQVSPHDPPRGSAAPAAADNLTGRCEVVNRDRRDRLTCNRIVAKRLIFRDYSVACNKSWLLSNRD